MESIDDRDIIMSYSVNLSGNAHIEIVVLDALQVLQVRLEHLERAWGNRDNEAKTQVRLDNQSENLVLGIHETKDANQTKNNSGFF